MTSPNHSRPISAQPSQQRYHALLPCAGTGSRSGAALAKQYVALGGQALVAHTLAALAAVQRIDSTLVVLAPDDTEFERRVPAAARTRTAAVRCGGVTRAATVRNGLDALASRGADDADWVLVHDAARCLIRAEWVDALIDACSDDEVGGLLAWPVADTLKTERAGRVAKTLDRTGTWQAQTPQMFRFGLLRNALAAASADVSDEAGAVEALGLAPKLVTGSFENFKVTHPADFALAERLLGSRR